jgi:hypothetical protein
MQAITFQGNQRYADGRVFEGVTIDIFRLLSLDFARAVDSSGLRLINAPVP